MDIHSTNKHYLSPWASESLCANLATQAFFTVFRTLRWWHCTFGHSSCNMNRLLVQRLQLLFPVNCINVQCNTKMYNISQINEPCNYSLHSLHVCIYIYTYECMYVYIYIYMYTHTHTRIYMCIYTHAPTHTHTHKKYIYTRIYTHTHAYEGYPENKFRMWILPLQRCSHNGVHACRDCWFCGQAWMEFADIPTVFMHCAVCLRK